jgi:hypothetical protein
MKNYAIKTATACYTGGGVYIYYGQLENGLFFHAADTSDFIWISDADTSTEEACYFEYYEKHNVETITDPDVFKTLWNAIIEHVLDKKPSFDKWNNYSPSDLKRRILK